MVDEDERGTGPLPADVPGVRPELPDDPVVIAGGLAGHGLLRRPFRPSSAPREWRPADTDQADPRESPRSGARFGPARRRYLVSQATMLKRYISVTWAKSFALEGGAILRQGGPHETARRPFRPSPAEILAPAPIPSSLRIVRGRRRPGRADPDPGRVQLRLAVQLQFELGDGRGRAQGRHLHDPGQLGLRRRRPGAELHAAAVAAAHRHPRRPG